MNKKIIFSLVLISLLVFVVVMAFSQNNLNFRWEYRAVEISGSPINITENANKLGQEGWELVSAYETTNHYCLIFKRRLQ